jgi:3-phosphoshikimate 1-carboxyvinyltransferase
VSRLRIRRSGPLRGRARLAGDLHIGQQALLWAALADGPCTVRGLGQRRDHTLLTRVLGELGVAVVRESDGTYQVDGRGLSGLTMPKGVLQAGDSATTLELVVALLSAQRFGTRVEVAQGARTRSLRTLILPLRERGANVAGQRSDDGDVHPPVAVAPLLADELLGEVEIAIPQGDPSTKLALLISGLYARGVTAISESMLSRDHAERALMSLGAPIQTAAGMTLLDTTESMPAWGGFDWQVPGDFTLASYVLAAAMIVEGSDVRVEGVGLNPTRIALLETLRGTGARMALEPRGEVAGSEPLGDLRVQSSKLSRVRTGGERAFGTLDEVPALLALSVVARDRVSVRDVGLLRSQSPDALKASSALLARFGVACTSYEDGLELDPPGVLTGAHVSADVPPPQALLGCVLGLVAEGETQIDAAETLDALYPGFVDTLIAMGANIERDETL